MGLNFPNASEDNFFVGLLKSMLANAGQAAVQGAVSGSLSNYFDNIKADRLREDAANQKGVEDLAASNERTIAPTVGPLEWAKMAKLNRSNPEMITEATPDWSGDRGRLLPMPNPAHEQPRAFLQSLKSPGGVWEEQGRSDPNKMPLARKDPEASVSVGVSSPVEDWAIRNPGVAEWAKEPAAKRAMDQSSFLEQLKAGGKNALKAQEFSFKGEQARLDREQKGKFHEDEMGYKNRYLAIQNKRAGAYLSKVGAEQLTNDPRWKSEFEVFKAVDAGSRDPRTMVLMPEKLDAVNTARTRLQMVSRQIAQERGLPAADFSGLGADEGGETAPPQAGAPAGKGTPAGGSVPPEDISAVKAQYPNVVKGMTDAQIAKGLQDGSLAAKINAGR